MISFLITLALATFLLLLCVVGLAIGKIVTGRSKLSCKRCGQPEKKRGSCLICEKKVNQKKSKG